MFRARWVLLEHRVSKDFLVSKGCKGHRERKELIHRDHKVPQVLKEPKGQQAWPLEHRELKVLLVPKVPKVLLVSKVRKDSKAPLVHKAALVRCPVHPESKERKDRKEPLVHRVLKVPQDRRVCKVPKDHKEHKVRLVHRERKGPAPQEPLAFPVHRDLLVPRE